MSTYSPAPRSSNKFIALVAVITSSFLFAAPAAHAQFNPVVSFKVPGAANFEAVCIDNKDNVAGWFFGYETQLLLHVLAGSPGLCSISSTSTAR